jgi:transketolase
LYSLLHLSGYPLTIDDLKHFRQLGSHTAGHPEHDTHLGIETTTGPLGQGLANGVGMALAEKILAANFNRPGHAIVDHCTWVFLGDGCLMEGVSHEACSLAGTLKLGKLICFYDDNGISIDGEVHGWFTDDTPKRFESYGWHVVPNVDGHDARAVEVAIAAAKARTDRPTLICCKTVIGYGAPNKQGTEATHGAALGADEVAAARKHLAWTDEPFVIPPEIGAAWDARARGAQAELKWRDRFSAYQQAFPELAAEYERRIAGDLPATWGDLVGKYVAQTVQAGGNLATRQSSQQALNALGPTLPELLGGSADLTGSNNTNRKDSKPVTGADASGNYVHYGVREFGMAAIMNGIALHAGLIPYGGTFLVFSDYARNGMRMSALMKQRVIYVMTHDSIGLGEDGPTHQPVEHLAALRAIPNLLVFRPCDVVETLECWQLALEAEDRPSALALTRQNLPQLSKDFLDSNRCAAGAYEIAAAEGKAEVSIFATGSEVAIAVDAKKQLAAKGVQARVVSIPCFELLLEAPEAKRRAIIGDAPVKIGVEAAVRMGWDAIIGNDGIFVGMDSFGASAPYKDLYKSFGITAEAVAEAALKKLGK